MLPGPGLRWLVHRAVRVLYAAEHAAGDVFLGIDELVALQRAYLDGHLHLITLLPVAQPQRQRFVQISYLPGSFGRAAQSDVCHSAERLRARCCADAPWLESFWGLSKAEGCPAYLTGSTLTAAIRPPKRPQAHPARDVDVFIEEAEGLGTARDLIRRAFHEVWGDATVEEEWCSATKLRLRVAGKGPGGTVDLYAHALERVSSYHFSEVRAAFDGDTLFCTVSAAVALATRFNADFAMTYKKERSLEVLARRWENGSTVLVNERELHRFLSWATQSTCLTGLSQTSRRTAEECVATGVGSCMLRVPRGQHVDWEEGYQRWRPRSRPGQ